MVDSLRRESARRRGRQLHAQAEAAAHLAAIVASSQDAIISMTLEGEITSWNAAAERIFGYPESQAVGRHISMLLAEGQKDVSGKMLGRVRAGEAILGFEATRKRKDGQLIELSMTVSPIIGARGQPVGASSIIRDITEQARAQRELQRLAEAAEYGTDAVVSIDLNGRVCHWNAGAERLYGFSAQETIGRDARDLIVPAEEIAQEIARILAGETAIQFETCRRRKDGSRVDVLITVAPWRRDGEIVGVTGISVDITARKQAERARERALQDLEEAQQLARIGSFTWDPQANRATWSAELYQIFGRDPGRDPPTDEQLLDYLRPDAAERFRVGMVRYRAEGRDIDDDWHITTDAGEQRIVHILGRADPARPGCFMGTVQDVTEQRQADLALKRAEERFRRAFDEAPIGMALLSREGMIERVNAAFGTICGRGVSELEGIRLRHLVHPGDIAILEEQLTALSRGEEVAGELRIAPVVGRARNAMMHAAPLLDAGQSGPLLCQFLDITERKQFEAQLQFMADHDPLTNLWNRRRFEIELDRHVESVKRYGQASALLVLDVDNFKAVNDTLGHSIGDQLIVSLAGRLRARLRASDIIARLGGDEFAVLLPHADKAAAARVADALLAAVRANNALPSGERKRITCSIGIATFTAQTTGEQALIEADLAMYDVKASAGNGYSFYSTAEHRVSRTQVRLTWTARLERALHEDNFELVAQPILDLHSLEVQQYELLLRMPGERDGELIAPGAFLYIAERVGLIGEIDEWVMARAIALIERRPELQLEINISGRSLGDQQLLRRIDQCLSTHRIDPTQLIFEVTETAAVANITHAQAFAQHLRDRGCRFALDDFGAGFGSFYYLKHLPFDYVKIDGEFIQHAIAGRIDQLVIEAVVRIAQGLGKRTIAEFVTDEQTMEMVTRLGVDYAQGYHVGMPTPLSELLQAADAS